MLREEDEHSLRAAREFRKVPAESDAERGELTDLLWSDPCMKPPSPAPSTSTRAGSSQTDCRSDCRIAFGSTRRSTASSAAARDETRRSGLAVLSFDDPDGAQDPFAHGIVEEITCDLSRSRDFHVIARQSAAALGDPSMDVAEAAARLGADYPVQGSVRRAGDHVRIAVRLVRGNDAHTLWSERFDDRIDDLFDLQDRIAMQVAGQTSPNVRNAEIERARATSPQNRLAYDLVLLACPPFWTLRPDDNLEAERLVSMALDHAADSLPASSASAGPQERARRLFAKAKLPHQLRGIVEASRVHEASIFIDIRKHGHRHFNALASGGNIPVRRADGAVVRARELHFVHDQPALGMDVQHRYLSVRKAPQHRIVCLADSLPSLDRFGHLWIVQDGGLGIDIGDRLRVLGVEGVHPPLVLVKRRRCLVCCR